MNIINMFKRPKKKKTQPPSKKKHEWNPNFAAQKDNSSIKLPSSAKMPPQISNEFQSNFAEFSDNRIESQFPSSSHPEHTRRRIRHTSEDEITHLMREDSFKDHAAGLLGRITALWKTKQLQDVVLAIGHHRIGAHKLVLAASSSYFCELFTSEENDPDADGEQFIYTLHGVSHDIIKLLLESMYTSHLHVSYDNIDELINAALYLRIQTALDSCTSFLLDNLTTDTCLQTLSVAISFEMEVVFDQASRHVAVHFMDLVNTGEFMGLSEEPLLSIIARDDLNVDSELEVFIACLQWLEADMNARLPYLVPIIQRVRLAIIKPTDIVDYIESVPQIMRNTQCESMVNEALHYHCLPHRQSVLQSSRTVPRASLRLFTLVTLGGQPRRVKEAVNSEVMYFNPVTEEWKFLTQMMQPRHHHAATVLGGFLYVAGGRETTSCANPLKTVHRYDPRTAVWMQIADMVDARESFQLGILDGNIYAVGGRLDEKTSLAAVERYDPYHDVWDPVHPLSDPRRCVAVAAHGGRLYAVGGSGNQKISSKVECFDPENNIWELRGHLKIPRFFSLLVSYGNYLYLAGGATTSGTTGSLHCIANIDQYDPATDTWTTLTSMTTPRAEMAGCVLDGKIYLVGGYNWEDKQWLKSSEMYDIVTESWSLLTDFPNALTGMSCCTLALFDPPI